MFKKTITIVTLCILSIASTWAVWEGNAAAGSADEFPSGLFASSDLFPKHTLIEIVNLEQNTKSRAVIVGNTGADGVLVKLSPDLAAALAVRQGTTVRVRVSIPPLVAEDGADPVLLTQNTRAAPALKQEAPQSTDDEVQPVESVQEEPLETAPAEVPEPPVTEVLAATASEPESTEEAVLPQEVAAVVEPVQEPVAETSPSEVEEPQTEGLATAEEASQPIAEVQEPEKPIAEEPEYSGTVAEVEEPVEPAPEGSDAQEEVLVEILPPEEPSQDAPVEYTEPVAEVSEPEAPQTSDTDVESAADAVPEVASSEEPADSPQAESAVAEAAAPAEEPEDDEQPLYDTDDGIPESLFLADEEDEESVEPVAKTDSVEEEEAVAEVPPIAQDDEYSQEEAVAEVAPIEPEGDEDAEAIAEVPPIEEDTSAAEPEIIAEEMPLIEEPEPLAAAEPEPEAPAVSIPETPLAVVPVEQHVMLVPAEPKAPRQEDMPQLPPAKAQAHTEPPAVKAEKPSVRAAEEPFVIDGLEKGAFYVQIARFTDMLNVQSFVQRYGKQYPISVEKSGMGSGSFYKVYIGPLQKDERGAALETFQRLGFKDAFLKKAP